MAHRLWGSSDALHGNETTRHVRSKKLVRNMQTPPPSWLSWFGSKAPEKNAAAAGTHPAVDVAVGDDDDYQIRKLKAQVSVLREDLELGAARAQAHPWQQCQ